MKYAVASVLWLTVAAYFLYMVRGRGD